MTLSSSHNENVTERPRIEPLIDEIVVGQSAAEVDPPFPSKPSSKRSPPGATGPAAPHQPIAIAFEAVNVTVASPFEARVTNTAPHAVFVTLAS